MKESTDSPDAKGRPRYLILIVILAALTWVKFAKDQSDGAHPSLLLPATVTISAVVSLILFLSYLRKKG